ncbi:MAG: glycyl-radical enzyme activating protein [Candidatus Heimdallarchaeota archaeon]
MEEKGTIFDIKKYAVHDGPGIRVTVFFKGCPMECLWCHNPESQKKESEKFIIPHEKSCAQKEEIIGREATVSEVMKEVSKDIIFFEESNGGVTFSGGEPLMQPDFLLALLNRSKELNLHTTLDTAGCATLDIIKQIAPKIDLFLYDIKLISDDKHKEYTGSSNEQILKNLEYLSKNNHKIIIRIPIIPTVNDSKEEIEKIIKYIKKLQIIKAELLPFHKIGDEKYRKLNKINRMLDIQPPTKEVLDRIVKQFQELKIPIKLEG